MHVHTRGRRSLASVIVATLALAALAGSASAAGAHGVPEAIIAVL